MHLKHAPKNFDIAAIHQILLNFAAGKKKQCGNFRIFLSLGFYVKSNFGESRRSKNLVLDIEKALNLVKLISFSLQKVQKIKPQSL